MNSSRLYTTLTGCASIWSFSLILLFTKKLKFRLNAYMAESGFIAPSSVCLKQASFCILTFITFFSRMLKYRCSSDYLSLPNLQTADDTGYHVKHLY